MRQLLIPSTESSQLSRDFDKSVFLGFSPTPQDTFDWSHSSEKLYYNKSAAAAAKSLQLCPTLCDPRNGSPPGSPVPGILQAITLEWVAISFSNA